MKSSAGTTPILMLAFIPTFSQSFSTSCSRSSSLRTLQFQLHLQSHTITALDDIITTPNNRIATTTTTTTTTTTRRRDIMLHAAMTMAFPSPSTAASAASIDTTIISGAGKFCGTFSDPINHPGGTRTISLIDDAGADVVGDYRLAQVVGGGGIGEPKEYVLPAVVVGDRAIIIDFSPKGGPRDFTGVLEKDGAIKFVRDGNRWPRIK